MVFEINGKIGLLGKSYCPFKKSNTPAQKHLKNAI